MELRSPAFASGEKIPTRFSADGERISPPLAWSDVPGNTVELALLLEDVNAREPRPFVHWIVYKIPPDQHALPEGIKHKAELELPARVVQGMNSMGAPSRWSRLGKCST